MRISIKKDVLLKALQKVCNIIGSRTTLPILANVLIETGEDGKLTLTATDLELRISTRVEADVQEAGSTTIPAKRLLGLVSKFKNEDVLIETNENHHSKITCGTAEFMLLGLDPRDFPAPVAFEPQRKLKLKRKKRRFGSDVPVAGFVRKRGALLRAARIKSRFLRIKTTARAE